jgi:hypothetical protein
MKLAHAASPVLLQPTCGEAAMCPVEPRSTGPNPVLAGGTPARRRLRSLPERFLCRREVCPSRGYLVTIDESTGHPVLTNHVTGDELGVFPPLQKAVLLPASSPSSRPSALSRRQGRLLFLFVCETTSGSLAPPSFASHRNCCCVK